MADIISSISSVMQAIWGWLGTLVSNLFGSSGNLATLGYLVLICFGLFIVFRIISYVKSLIRGY